MRVRLDHSVGLGHLRTKACGITLRLSLMWSRAWDGTQKCSGAEVTRQTGLCRLHFFRVANGILMKYKTYLGGGTREIQNLLGGMEGLWGGGGYACVCVCMYVVRV